MKRSVGLIVVALLLAAPGMDAAQRQAEEVTALKAELEALKAGQAAIQRELQAIRELLSQGRTVESPQPPQPAPERFATVEGAPSKGNPAAKVTLIEFSDFQCPFCARHAHDTFAAIEKTYVNTGKVRYVFRNFPIEGIHPLAFKAHEASGCAAEQGKFWEMHTRLFDNQELLDPEELPKHALAIGLAVGLFQACLESERTATRIRQDMAEGRSIGANATPMFFVGLTEPNNGKVKVLRVLRGAQSFARFQEAIDSVFAMAQEVQ